MLIWPVLSMAQPEYPTPPTLPFDLSRLEYYFDNDPGAGNGIPVTIAASQSISSLSFNADVSGIVNGFHRIYVRSMNTDGKWSLTANGFFDNYVVPVYAVVPAATSIAEAEWFVDNDPGFGNGNKLAVAAGQEQPNQQFLISISGLAGGTHQLYIRSRDISGQWSLTYFAQFDNTAVVPYPSATIAPPVGEMEYYIDTDPGFGNGAVVAFASGTDISNLAIDIPMNTITPGHHTIYIRSRQNPWSLSAYADFNYGSTLPLTWLYVRGETRNNKGFISWATASEENTDSFIVEYSADGRSFIDVGEVAAASNSTNSRHYNFLHDGLKEGMNYYRVRQVDKDGKYTYSKVITLLQRDNLRETVVAPNPVKDILHIVEPVSKWVKTIEVYSTDGRLLSQQNINALSTAFSIPVGSLPGGTYMLKIVYKDEFKTFRIIKE
jgi:hypothetical protein